MASQSPLSLRTDSTNTIHLKRLLLCTGRGASRDRETVYCLGGRVWVCGHHSSLSQWPWWHRVRARLSTRSGQLYHKYICSGYCTDETGPWTPRPLDSCCHFPEAHGNGLTLGHAASTGLGTASGTSMDGLYTVFRRPGRHAGWYMSVPALPKEAEFLCRHHGRQVVCLARDVGKSNTDCQS